MGALSAGAQGLLSGLSGALGAKEKSYQDDLETQRERSLEDYRLERQKMLADYKNEMTVTAAELKNQNAIAAAALAESGAVTAAGLIADAKVTDREDTQEFEKLRDDANRASRERNADVTAGSRGNKSGKNTAGEVKDVRYSQTKAMNEALFDSIALNDPGAIDVGMKSVILGKLDDPEFVTKFFDVANVTEDVIQKYKPQYDQALLDFEDASVGGGRSVERAAYAIPEFGNPDLTSVNALEADTEGRPDGGEYLKEYPGLAEKIYDALNSGGNPADIKASVVKNFGLAVWNRIERDRTPPK